MRHKPTFRFMIAFQAALFTGYGLILKNLEDTLGDKLLWTGVVVLAFFVLRASYRLAHKNQHKKESA